MDEKKDAHINFELHRELSKKNVADVVALLKQLEQQTSERLFDASRQNFWVAGFFFTLNPEPFLAQAEKSGLNVQEAMTASDSSRSVAQQLARFYAVYNYLYFSKIAERNLPLVDQLHCSFRSATRSADSLPNFPLLKTFVAQMNFYFNGGAALRFFRHFEEIHRLLEYAQKFRPLRQQILADGKYLNSCFYGGTFYFLADIDQQGVNPLEVEAAGQLLLVLGHFLARNPGEVTSGLSVLAKTVAKVKEQSTQPPPESKTDPKAVFEWRLRSQVTEHLDAVTAFLALLKKLRFENGVNAFEIVSAPQFFQGTRMKKKYHPSVLNLLALSNFRAKNFTAAHRILSKLCEKFREPPAGSPDKPAVVAGLSRLNLPLLKASLTFNLFVTQFCLGDYARAVAVGETLVHSFGGNHRFWYLKGLCHFHLWQREVEAEKQRKSAETAKLHREVSRTLERRRVRVLSFPEPSSDWVAQQHGLNAFRTLEGDTSSRHVVLAISSLENSLNILQNAHSKDALSSVFQRTNQRFKEYINGVKVQLTADAPRHLLSVLEHLTYLYLLTNKPMQALKTISLATTSATPKLGVLEEARFASYHLKAALMIRKPSELKKGLSEAEAALSNSEKENAVLNLPRNGVACPVPAAFLLKYNRLLSQPADREAGQASLGRLLEEFVSLPDKTRSACEPLVRNALFFFFSRVEFSRDMLRQITSPLFDVSKIALNRNGKSAGVLQSR